jgi:hypothetical protein
VTGSRTSCHGGGIPGIKPNINDMTRVHVAGLWRYPVKSLAGEPLPEAVIGQDGIPGDRIVHVRGPEGVRTSRRHYRLLGLQGTLGPGGRPLIDGYSWDGPDALRLVKAAAGNDAWLEASDDPGRCWSRPTAPSPRLAAMCAACGRISWSAASKASTK